MLASMSVELQRQHEHLMPFEMMSHLKGLFENVSKSAKYDILRELFKLHMNDGGDVSAHVLKMIGFIERLAVVGVKFETKVSVIIILQSLPDSYSQFIINYNMSAKEVTLYELHNMLKTYQQALPKGKQVLMVSKSSTPKALKPKEMSNKNKCND